jgi:hypothetical protein
VRSIDLRLVPNPPHALVVATSVTTEPKEEGEKPTPETITIDDDSESDPELVSDFCLVCACGPLL